jgi:spore coat protein U-like protein
MRQAMKRLWVGFAPSLVMIILFLATPTVTHAAGHVAVGAAGPIASSGQCMVAATPVAFGMYDPLLHQDGVTVGMLHYRCSGTPKRLTIGLTTGDSSSFRARRLGRGSNAIKYNLYLDAACTQIWGDGTGGSQTYIVNSPSSGSEVSIPVYGRLFGDRNASAGNYHDNVSVVVTY